MYLRFMNGGRTMWNVVDVVVAIGLVALWLREHKNR